MERQKKIALTRYTQDNDLLLDIENSDLLPIQIKTMKCKDTKQYLV